MAQTQPATKPETVYPLTAFSLPKTGKARGALAKRFDHTVFVEFDIASLPRDVLRDLLLEALQTKVRAAVKKLNQEACTEDEIKAAMTEAVNKIKSGKATGGKVKPKMDEETKAIRAEARAIMRERIKAALEASDEPEALTGKQITSKISEFFKARDAFHRNPTKNAEFKAKAAAVDDAMKAAADRIKQRTESGNVLGPLVAEMVKAAQTETDAPAKPKAAKPKPKATSAKGQGAPAR